MASPLDPRTVSLGESGTADEGKIPTRSLQVGIMAIHLLGS